MVSIDVGKVEICGLCRRGFGLIEAARIQGTASIVGAALTTRVSGCAVVYADQAEIWRGSHSWTWTCSCSVGVGRSSDRGRRQELDVVRVPKACGRSGLVIESAKRMRLSERLQSIDRKIAECSLDNEKRTIRRRGYYCWRGKGTKIQ